MKADYKDPKVITYRDNPFIEALPPIYPEEIAMELMRSHLPYCKSWRNEPDEIRLQYIMDLERYVLPLNKFRDLERLISRMIRIAYVSRNPVQKGYSREIDKRVEEFFKALKLDIENYLPDEPYPKVTGFALFGISGTGKTTAMERVLSLYPQVIQHRKYKNHILTLDQLVWLKLETPHNGSTKALCTQFFKEVDDILGTEYKRTHTGPKLSEEDLVQNMSRVALLQGLGFLVIDEFQHLSAAKSGGQGEMLNFLTNLVNHIGVPIVLIGTPKAIKILAEEFRETRRVSGYHFDTWDRLNKNNPATASEWKHFIEDLWSYQYTKEYTPLSDELSDIILEETQGITDFVIKLFMLAQIRAIESEKEKLTSDIIKSAAIDGFQLARPVLNALKTNDINALENYEDVYLNVQEHLESVFPNTSDSQNAIFNELEYKKILAGLVAWLKDCDCSYQESLNAAERSIMQLGITAPIPKLKKLAYQYALEGVSENNKTKATRKNTTKNKTGTGKGTKQTQSKNTKKYEVPSDDNLSGYNSYKTQGLILEGKI